MRVDICIITCMRPNGLRRLLGGLQQLRVDETGFELRIVVVDNDAAESARSVCADAAGRQRHPLCYVTEKRRGIPQARNAALAVSLREADFVAFIDDDEVPDPDWLAELLRTQAAYTADAVAGPVVPLFEGPPPRWIEEGAFFEHPRHETGVSIGYAYTNNVLVSTRSLAEMDALFEERFALSGGSDKEFFERFAARGHRIVWCDSARAHEWIPRSRACLGWLLQRALRVGTSTTLIERLRSERSPGVIRIAAHGGWCIVKGTVMALLGVPRGRGAAARGLHLATFGVGRLAGLSGWSHQEYRTIHGS